MRWRSTTDHVPAATSAVPMHTTITSASRQFFTSGHFHRLSGFSTSFVRSSASRTDTTTITTPERGPATGRSRTTR